MTGIYIHIPFCVKKCLYCDFVSACGTQEEMRLYKDALIQEIAQTEIPEEIDSIFIGGGTPSVIPVSYIEEILRNIYAKYSISMQAEISIEANPGTLTKEKLDIYRKSGVNRISIGLQTADDEELKNLGRIYRYQEFSEAYEMARDAEFQNINVDLMSAIPGQNMKSYQETIEKVLQLKPEHISAYSLIIEEGTPFYEWYGDDTISSDHPRLPDEEEEREMYYYTKKVLAEHGYERYEISNYARKGYECRHNLKYWSRENYYGFGVAAASLVNHQRYTNISDRQKYITCLGDVSQIREEILPLTEQDEMEEYMFLGLRKMSGVSKTKFEQIFHVSIGQVYGDVIDRQKKTGLLKEQKDRLLLTDKGIDVSNMVMSEYLLERR